MKTKRNRRLYALTCTQTNNKIENTEITLPPCFEKALLFKGKKTKEGKGNKT